MIEKKRRGVCIWVGFAVVFVLTMFPPWVETMVYADFPSRHWRLWHAPEWGPPMRATTGVSLDVDYRRMLTEIGAGECFVLALYLTWGRTQKEG